MAPEEDLVASMRKATLNDNSKQPPTSPPSTQPKSFLHSMNEKLAQRQMKPRGRGRGRGRGGQHQSPRHPPPRTAPQPDPSTLYTLGFLDEFLGVFSTFEAATTAARSFGGTEQRLQRWSDDGFREYVGKLRITPRKVARRTNPSQPNDEDKSGNEPIEDTRPSEHAEQDPLQDLKTVYLAFSGTMELGVFTAKQIAWEACLKHMRQVTYSVKLADEHRWVGKDGMPCMAGRIDGSGQYFWCVREYEIGVVERGKDKKEALNRLGVC